MKRFTLMLTMLIFSPVVFAQQALETKSFWDDPFNHPMTSLYIVSAFVFVVLILVIFVALYVIRVLRILTIQSEQGRAKNLGIPYVPSLSWWSRFSQTMNASVPLEKEKTIELDHNFDGIKELDNHLPPWWKWLFYGTIGWAAVYIFVFHISGTLPLSLDEYHKEIADAEEQVRKLKASQPQAEIDENSLMFTLDSVAFITKGKAVFMDNNCGSCHRNDGGGNAIGPNLTDTHWLHGGHIKNVFSTIRNGVVEKGMPAWGRSLSPQQVRDVAFFVMSLQGTNPANPKAPQGEIYKALIVPRDSTNVQASL
jgi:cytochrome c oxidase cbb3-type subunit 3